MKILLDTHIWVWWVNQSNNLPNRHGDLIGMANQIVVSAISCWEVVMLIQRKRINLPIPVSTWLQKALEPVGVECIPVCCSIAESSALLPQHHRDPADRVIISTALENDLYLMSFDTKFSLYSSLESRLIHQNNVSNFETPNS